jgi:ABC-type hemin transport system ATPase subunit
MGKYQTDLSAGSLLISESKVIAELMRQGLDAAQISERVVAEILLKNRSVQYTKKVMGAILDRLGSGEETMLNLIVGERQVATSELALFNAARLGRAQDRAAPFKRSLP